MTIDIPFSRLVLMAALLFPLFPLCRRLEINLVKDTLISLVRMFLQLTLVGIYLQYIFSLNNSYVNFLYLLVMIIIASATSIKSLNLKLKKTFWVISIPMLIPVVFLVLLFNGLIIGVEPIWEAKYLIPVSGMILGNCLTGSIIALNHFFGVFKKKRKVYLYSIALGAGRVEALKSHMREAVKAVLQPAIAGMATLGIVTLPGMMTGQILGGSLPMTAIKYQIAIMILIFAVKMYNALFVLYLSTLFFFDSYNMPKEDIFK